MASSGVVEPVDVSEDRSFSLRACWPVLPPKEFRFDGLEKSFDRSVVVTIAFAAHRRDQSIFLQPLLVIVRTILAAAIGVNDATLWWIAKFYCHVQCLDRQIFFILSLTAQPMTRRECKSRTTAR